MNPGDIHDISPSFDVVHVGDGFYSKKLPVMASDTAFVPGVCMPHPDNDPLTILGGLMKRIAREPGAFPAHLKRSLRQYVDNWCKDNLTPLTEVPDFESWIENAPYTAKRKAALIEAHLFGLQYGDLLGGISLPKKYKNRVNCFVKSEVYEKYKQARGIFSRPDLFKVVVGPIFQAISDHVFHATTADNGGMNPFIKTVPVRDRPAEILKLLLRANADYIVTDYSSYEAHFTVELMNLIEMRLYHYMTKLLPIHDNFMKLLHDSIQGENIMKFGRRLTAKLIAKRMSGEMNTSLGNGFSNYMMLKWLTWRRDPLAVVRAVVEGDDGLFTVFPKEATPTTKDFTDVGAIIKLEKQESLSEASFCGLVFDLDDQAVIADPLKHMAKVGWYQKRHVNCKTLDGVALLRARGYSFVYQYPGCPVLEELGRWLLRNTEHITKDRVLKMVDREAIYERELLLNSINNYDPFGSKAVTDNTRDLMHRYFGVSAQQQIILENWFKENDLEPIKVASPSGDLDLPWNEAWIANDAQYVTQHRDFGAIWGSGDIQKQCEFELSSYESKLRESGHSEGKIHRIGEILRNTF